MGTSLVTLAEYKQSQGISSSDQDKQIELLLTNISNFVKEYCNRSFIDYYDTDKVEIFNGYTKDVFVSEIPIIQVVSVKTSVDGGVTKTTLTEITDYIVNKELGIITAINTHFVADNAWSPISLEVTYNAGYLQAPDDIKQAVIELVKYYKDREYVLSKTISGTGFQGPPTIKDGLPSYIQNILDIHRIL